MRTIEKIELMCAVLTILSGFAIGFSLLAHVDQILLPLDNFVEVDR